jgi:hypothetical protein
MTNSKTSSRDFATTSFSFSRPTAANTGLSGLGMVAGAALCAATQIEQEAASVWLGWLWRDSAAAVHNISDRHSQADQRRRERIRSCIGIDALRVQRLYAPKQRETLYYSEPNVSVERSSPPGTKCKLHP